MFPMAKHSKELPLVLLLDSCFLHRLIIRILSQYSIPYRINPIATSVIALQLLLSADLGVSCLN